ncbi:glycoside hydrolase family 16 protein [Noviherbaspirillum sp. 17J57-3]|uniref:Glycoside hydrolase family 16 protein n=2 Tax=Noviherbaspirillum galbum TaxID=2709383 RepID=A0A6B3STC9_9BURK|nr:glycoside hydrolase family 16 protein [Noviherbaspirillum galbum]
MSVLLTACGGGSSGDAGSTPAQGAQSSTSATSLVQSSTAAVPSAAPTESTASTVSTAPAASTDTSTANAASATPAAPAASTTQETQTTQPTQATAASAPAPTTTAAAAGNTTNTSAGTSQQLADAVVTGPDSPTGQNPDNFTLTFKDEFDTDLDSKRWRTDRTDTWSSIKNYAVENGTLKIWPQRGNDGAFFNRTIDTEGRFTQQYGYFEIEAKLPKGKGAWPAFWLFNQFGERRPEIDIMEAYPGGLEPWSRMGADGVPVATMYAPVAWTDSTSRAGYAKVETPDLSADFHRYGLKWEPNRQTFYFDGREVFTLDVSMSDPMYIILDLWFGSASGTPDDSTPTGPGNSYEIKYVKAWQFK